MHTERSMVTTLCAIALLGQTSYAPTGAQIQVTMGNNKSFVITCDPKASPKTVARVTELVRAKFYDGIRFHRVEDWVRQWGDPTSRKSLDGAGSGGSGKALPFEGSKVSFLRGVVGVASTGAGVGGDSQLFIIKKDSARLDGKYAVVGKVTQGMNVVDAIVRGDTIKTMRVLARTRR